MAETISIYESIGRNLGEIISKGTPTNCTATTFQSDVLIHPLAEQLIGKEAFIYSGGGAGQSRIVGSFDPSNNRVAFERLWNPVPSTNSSFIIFSGQHRVEDYESAMNRALGVAKLKYLEEKVGTTQLVGTQYEYPVPSGFEYISNIRLVPSSNTDYAADDEVDSVFELPPHYWRIERNVGGSYVVAFDARKINLATIDKEFALILGQAKPDFSGTTINADLEEFVIAYSSMQLAGDRIDDGRKWQAKFYQYRDEIFGRGVSPGLEDYIHRQGHGKKVG